MKKEVLDLEDLFSVATNYPTVCRLLEESELTEDDYCFIKNDKARRKALANGKIEQIQRLFNGDWIPKFDSSQYNWYPFFTYSYGGLLGFCDSGNECSYFSGRVSFYKDKKTSDFVGKTFIDIYIELY